jgi:membrane dipeptidase
LSPTESAHADPASEQLTPVFDGHNDYLARAGEEHKADFLTGENTMHLSLERCRAGGFAGGLFAHFIPPNQREQRKSKKTSGGGSLPAAVPLERAQRVIAEQFARLRALERAAAGELRVCTSAADIERAIQHGVIAAVPHLEGAEPIDRDLSMLELLHAAGFRSLGIVWSRPNRFGSGTPLLFGHTPEVGGGLSTAGKALVERCNALRINIDVSHLTSRGFWDVAALSDAPLVASHSNAWALCRNARNLTDEQLDAIARSDGFVGINFGTVFLREDGSGTENTPLSRITDHIRYVAERVGVERVGFGSDFDGTPVPKELGGAAGLPKLLAELRSAGFTEHEIDGFASRNWLAALRRVWGE